MHRAPDFAQRLRQLQTQLQPTQAFLLSQPQDLRYFTGLENLVAQERDALLLVTPAQTYLIHAAFSPVPSHPAWQLKVGLSPVKLTAHLQEMHQQHPWTELLIDKSNLVVEEAELVENAKLGEVTGLNRAHIWQQRMIKDEAELAALKKSGTVMAEAMTEVMASLKPGITELEVAYHLAQILRDKNCHQLAFPTIVAFGPHSAVPHHQPTHTPLTPETVVLIDAGATVAGYCSDMTRTSWFGKKPSARFLAVEKTIHQAYQAGLSSLTSAPDWPTAGQLDTTIRQVLAQAELSHYFIHTSGHGLGLDIHEPPSLSAANARPLQTNMVITIEPGVYFADEWGYRYENTVWLSKAGAQVLTDQI